jgi:hypothetical protein
MNHLLVGTDRRTLVTASAHAESESRTRAVPAGMRHAVPRGARVALCGEAPAVVWVGEQWPGGAQQDLCPLCRFGAGRRARAASGAQSQVHEPAGS